MTEHPSDSIDVADHPDQKRYEVRSDSQLAGSVEYRLRPGRIVFTHTEIDDAFEGQGLGGKLARAALDDARARGLRVTPLCPFIAEWIRRHPDYAELVEASTNDSAD